MSFSKNSSQQISLFDAASTLTEREKRMLERSWAKYFADHIFPEIDEAPFSVLYSDRPSRHNTPVNVIIGALILKEIFGLTDEEIVETLPFDIRYQYALHTTSFEEQPLNDRTLGRFRARCCVYEEMTGIDLIHDCIVKLSSSMAAMMKLNTGMRRMDSLMVASNIKKMSRLELLYTSVANLVNILAKQYRDSGIMSTDVPDEDTGIDRLDCFPQNSHQCQAQSRFAVHSRLDIVVDSEIIDAANQAFYCGTL